jgi:hypothetical protein
MLNSNTNIISTNLLSSDKRKGVDKGNGFWIHCSTRECRYTWYYTGNMRFYATCPSCKRNVRIEKNKISDAKGMESQYFDKQVGPLDNRNIATKTAPSSQQSPQKEMACSNDAQ